MSSPQLQLVLWILQPLLLLPVAVVMFRRKQHKEFPVFFGFAIVQIAIFCVEFPIYQLADYHAYFFTFWVASIINLILDFKILHEIFLDIFRPYHALKDLGTALFKWAALIMILVSAVLISTNPIWNDPVGRSVLLLQRCMRVIQCGLVLFLLAFCSHLSVSWRRQSFGLACGFGIFAATELIMTALFSGGHVSNEIMNIVEMAGYNFAVFVWLFYSVLNRRELSVPVLIPQRWDNALMELHPHSEPDSLIPMFEHMVDRAFSRTQDPRHA
jgi:hypothetical protein